MTSPANIVNSLHLGQLLMIETHRELLVGTLKYIDTKRLLFELENARDIKTNFTYQSPQMLAYQQMKSIKIVQQAEAESPTDSNTESEELLLDLKSSKTKTSPVKQERQLSDSSKEQCEGLCMQLSALDLQGLQTQLDSMIFITQTDQKYHKALANIRSETIIGLLIDPVQTARHRKTSLIAVSTPRNIYIFDILNLGTIFREFRLILESEKPRKAVHFSHRMVDHFKHRHDLELSGIFDTFVAYCVASGEKRNMSLEETVQCVFNISNTYFEPQMEINPSSNPYNRPLSQDYRLVIAKKVAFQLKLYEHLLHEQMLKNFYKQCQKFSQTLSQNEDEFQVAQQLHPDSRAGHEHIQLNGNWKDLLETDFQFVDNAACEKKSLL